MHAQAAINADHGVAGDDAVDGIRLQPFPNGIELVVLDEGEAIDASEVQFKVDAIVGEVPNHVVLNGYVVDLGKGVGPE